MRAEVTLGILLGEDSDIKDVARHEQPKRGESAIRRGSLRKRREGVGFRERRICYVVGRL